MSGHQWVYWPVLGKWRDLTSGNFGFPKKGDWYCAVDGEWRIW